MDNPTDRKYTKEHQWIKFEGDIGTIGITDHAQKELKDIVFVELPEVDNDYEKGKEIASIESVKSVSEVFSPVGGKVIEVNSALEDDPTPINNDPYGEGWIAKIQVDSSDDDGLLDKDEYEKSLA